MDDALLVHLLDALNHLDGDYEHGLQIELAFAVGEQLFERVAQEVHDHNVVDAAVLGLLVADEVQIRHAGCTMVTLEERGLTFTPKFVDQFRFPEEHDMSLVLHRFFLEKELLRALGVAGGTYHLGSKDLSGLLLLHCTLSRGGLTFIDFAKGPSSQALDDFIALVEDFLTFI